MVVLNKKKFFVLGTISICTSIAYCIYKYNVNAKQLKKKKSKDTINENIQFIKTPDIKKLPDIKKKPKLSKSSPPVRFHFHTTKHIIPTIVLPQMYSKKILRSNIPNDYNSNEESYNPIIIMAKHNTL